MNEVSERNDDRRGVSRTAADLRSDLARTDLARHLALFYRDRTEQLEGAATFVSQGLRAGNRCLYLLDENDDAAVESALAAVGVDVDERVAAGDLRLRDAADVYLDGGFDPDAMVEALTASVEECLTDGYDGLWVAGENSWCFHTEVPFDDIMDFEADFDATCPDLPVTALCQYGLDRFDQDAVAKAITTHRQIVYRNAVCENPYYTPPEEYRARGGAGPNARLMLEQTYDLADAHRQVKRREQRLAVLNRVLRHNLRNDLNVVGGNVELVREEATLSTRSDDRLETAQRHLRRLIDTAEKARYVQETLEGSTVEPVAVDEAVARAVAAASERYPEATISVDGETDATVLADRTLGEALEELLDNAILHQPGAEPVVWLTVATPEPDVVRIDVGNPGPAVPADDRDALHAGRESELRHASGLGLWFVKWMVENAGGTFELPAGEGPQVRLHLQRER